MTAPASTPPAPGSGRLRRLAVWLHTRPRAQRRLLLSGPLGWMFLVYFGSLAILLLGAFWAKDSFTGQVEPFEWSIAAFDALVSNEVYRTIAVRTISIAVLVTVTDVLLAFPIAYYIARDRIAADARRADHRDPHAAVGVVPGQGVRVADHPPGERVPRVGARPVGRRRARARSAREHVARAELPVAART